MLWMLLGWFLWQIGHEWNKLRQPLIQEGKINIDGVIASIKNVITTENLWWEHTTYQRFDTIYDILQNSYYNTDKLNTWKMLNNAIKAYVDAIDDPYTIYMDSEQNSGFQEELKWSSDFEGIGAVISKKDYYIQIDEVIKWSPAFNAWLKLLDRILMINTWSTKGLDVNEAVHQIRGPKWSKVLLTIERIYKDGNKELIEKEIIRDKLVIPSVNGKLMTWINGEHLWYINISIIWEETENLLTQTLHELQSKDIKGIILDLRGNWWGILPIAVKIASHFIPKDTLVVSTKYTVFEDEKMLSLGYSYFQNIPIVVLVDWLTASAGEIIALALQQTVGAQLVWTQTFGKWSIQTMNEFPDWTSLKYTVGKRYAPNNTNIDTIWITPDVVIEFDIDAYIKNTYDNQLEKAKETLSNIIK